MKSRQSTRRFVYVTASQLCALALCDLSACHLNPSTNNQNNLRSNALTPPRSLEREHHNLLRTEIKRSKIPSALYLASDDDNNELDSHGNGNKGKKILLTTTLLSFGLTTAAAKAGFFPLKGGSPYPDTLLFRDQISAAIVVLVAGGFVRACSLLAKNGLLEPRDSRKIIHTFSAPLFIFTWPLFSDASGARFFAGIIPLIQMVTLFLAGSGTGGEEESDIAKAVSRSGNIKEALGGPFIYVVVLLLTTVIFWRENLIGVVTLSAMAAGDGVADLVGRRFGKTNKWSFSPDKSIAGSSAFFVASTFTAVGLALWLSYTGSISLTAGIHSLVSRIAFICFVSAIVELLPVGNDNWSVPISTAALSALLLT